MEPGDDVFVLSQDEFGLWVTQNKQIVDEIDEKFVGKKKEVLAARQAYIEANASMVPEKVVTKQRVQFKMAEITKDSAEDIGRSVKRDIVNIAAANEHDDWHMSSGVRFPNEKCPNCPMRGICANRPDLRDQLLVRKQLDELDFGKESE